MGKKDDCYIKEGEIYIDRCIQLTVKSIVLGLQAPDDANRRDNILDVLAAVLRSTFILMDNMMDVLLPDGVVICCDMLWCCGGCFALDFMSPTADEMDEMHSSRGSGNPNPNHHRH